MTGPLNFNFDNIFASTLQPIDPGIDPPLPIRCSTQALSFVDNIDNLELINFRKKLEVSTSINNIYRHQLGLEDYNIRFSLYEEHENIIYELKNIERKITYNWEKSFESLLKFKEVNNHLNVPKNLEYSRLYSWVNLQRTLYKKQILGEEFVEKLNSIGFIWDINFYNWKENYKKYEELIANSDYKEIYYYKIIDDNYFIPIYKYESLNSYYENNSLVPEKDFIIRWMDKQIKEFISGNLEEKRTRILIREFRKISRFEENKWIGSICNIMKFYRFVKKDYGIDCYLKRVAPDKSNLIKSLELIYSRKNIIEICQTTGVRTRVLPSTEEMMKKGGVMNNLRDVEIEDLLGRDTIKLDNKNITDLIKGKNVLVTGGGGSIGSELCRQIMKYNPAKLIIFDIYENNLYDIQMELDAHYPKTKIEAIVGSVRDKERLRKVFEKYSPKLVFHAAAHKHVPLMENSPFEAIKNNIFGTYNVANCADEFGVERFVLISTDKAVNPTNIMGASKRVCEMIIQAKNKVSKTDYVAVRFGNVLGSNGSVIPLFKKQIAEGGPVTVTHKDITRFFMTIPEAVGLILQAITYAEGGEIFVLDMGKPVKIYDLAISLIKLSGYEPGVDIPIQFTGLREGEKLYEELLMAEEGLTATKHNKIFVSQPMNLGMEELESKLNKLSKIKDNDMNLEEEVKQVMKQVVPTYKEPDEVNKKIVNEKKGTNENTQKVEATANT
mgnify:CR=1 FL=1